MVTGRRKEQLRGCKCSTVDGREMDLVTETAGKTLIDKAGRVASQPMVCTRHQGVQLSSRDEDDGRISSTSLLLRFRATGR